MAENHPTTAPRVRSGALNNNWRGGRHVASNGYVKVSIGEGHPLADSKGYIYEHLWVWISAGNPLPEKGELIHHRDGNKQNNALENLELKTVAAHMAHHAALRGLTAEQIHEAAERYRAGETYIELAAEYGVGRCSLSKLLRSIAGIPRVTKERLTTIGQKGAAARWRKAA